MISNDKSSRYIPFSGKREEWRMWSGKFLARGNKLGYRAILEGTTNVPNATDTLDATNASHIIPIKNRELNENAYDDLIMAMDDNVCYGKVDEAKTKKLPYGDARLAWTNLEKDSSHAQQ